jgi:hypothetical protein
MSAYLSAHLHVHRSAHLVSKAMSHGSIGGSTETDTKYIEDQPGLPMHPFHRI